MSGLRTRRLGESGLEVPVVGLGCNNFGRRLDLNGTRAVVDAAIEHGVAFFDTADIYGRGASEELLGEVLAGRRDQVVLATKFGMDMGDGLADARRRGRLRVLGRRDTPRQQGPRGSRGYILQAIEASLRRLRTDVVDFYWYHQPDGVTPISETLETLDELVRAGTVRAIGASNFSAEQIEEADRVARERGLTRFRAIQNEYSLLARDAEHAELPACERLGLGFVPYFPLASGLLSGKYRRGRDAPPSSRLSGRERVASEEQFALLEALEAYARQRRLSLLDVAIGALLARQVVSSVIAGATRPEQVAANAQAGKWTPSEDDLVALRAVLDADERPGLRS